MALAGAGVCVFPDKNLFPVMALSAGLVGDQLPTFGHFYPAGISIVATKVTFITLSARLRVVQKRIEEIEEEDEEAIMQIELADVVAPSRHKHELSIWRGFGKNLRVGVARELAIISTQRAYEHIAMRFFLEDKMSRSIVKNCPRSAARKSTRYKHSSVLVYASKVLHTTLKSQCTFWFALFSVNQAVDTWLTFRPSEQKDMMQRSETYSRRLLLNALRCMGGCVLAACGAAIGSSIKPGIGTSIGMNMAPQFIFMLV